MTHKKKLLSWGKKRIVAIGGGTGLSSLLSGLKKYSHHLTAIVTVMDDGGSSGALRKELSVLPPGDIRNCLVALADKEQLLAKLFQYRFTGGGTLQGHSFGNLFLSAMADVMNGFDRGIAEASKVLAIRGTVLPVTLEKVRLKAEYHDGDVVYGQTNISSTRKPIAKLSLTPITSPKPAPEVLKSIAEADAIVLGPGSLYTSIIPNLLVQDVASAIAHAPAIVIYICNIMTQPWETYEYNASDHLRTIENVLGNHIINYIILNNGPIPQKIKQRYRKNYSVPVFNDIATVRKRGIKIRLADVVHHNEYIRHNSDRLARTVLSLLS